MSSPDLRASSIGNVKFHFDFLRREVWTFRMYF
nr:MAG TPA: hypothetical protein [Caudoviricetes sp.]